MNILLATYNYYPYNYGGTEVYVSGLASYLQQQGHNVTIIAGMPPEAFQQHAVYYEDDQLKTVKYFHDGIDVVGVILKENSTTDIYTKFRTQWVHSFTEVLKKILEQKWDVLHIHANTSAIGRSLINAAKTHSNNIKIIASYHLPVSCVKGTLLFANTMKPCTVKPSVTICTACCISTKFGLPIQLTKLLATVSPQIAGESMPTPIRLKFLVKQFIQSFTSFDDDVNLWHVFSQQMKDILEINGVAEKKICLLRHGVKPVFLESGIASVLQKKKKQVKVFLFAARFNKLKGFLTLMKAWCSMMETSSRELWMVGENETVDEEISNYITAAAQRKDIKWLGIKTQEELAVIMRKVHCTIIPSEWIEIGPLVFHEAIAAGSDVIASDIGGCRELVLQYKNKSSMFETANVKSLKEKIIEFEYSGKTEQPQTQLQNHEAVLQSYYNINSN